MSNQALSALQSNFELEKSNVNQYECDQLLKESHLNLVANQEHQKHRTSVKWSNSVEKSLLSVENNLISLFNGLKTDGSRTIPIPSPNTCGHLKLRSDKYKKLGTKWKIHIPKKIEFQRIGSYPAGCMTKKDANGLVLPIFDVVLVVGKQIESSKDSFWSPKDYLNYRHLDKRNLLLYFIGTHFSSQTYRKSIGEVAISPCSYCSAKLSLLITPSEATDSEVKGIGNKKAKFRIRIVVGNDHDLFPATRFFPTRNNLPAFDVNTDGHGTPFYNSCVLASDGMHRIISDLLLECSNINGESDMFGVRERFVFSEAIVLLKVWLAQRGMRNGHDTINSTGACLILIFLMRKKMINNRMNVLEIIIIWLKFVSETDWLGENNDMGIINANEEAQDNLRYSASLNNSTTYLAQSQQRKRQKVLIMPDRNVCDNTNLSQTHLYEQALSSESEMRNSKLPRSLVEAYQEFTDGPIFLDSTMRCNFLAHCSPSAMRELIQEAKSSLSVINHQSAGMHNRTLNKLFCTSCRFWRKYDMFVKVKLNQIDMTKINTKAHVRNKNFSNWTKSAVDFGLRECVSRGLVNILRLALSDRITMIRSFTSGNGEVHVSAPGAQEKEKKLNVHCYDDCIFDADQILSYTIKDGEIGRAERNHDCDDLFDYDLVTPSHASSIVLGLKLNPETATRIIDRGPPSDNLHLSSCFVSLFGRDLCKLRRFKDGAIVQAVLWRDIPTLGGMIEFCNVDSSGGLVEKIIQHVATLHFLKENMVVKSELRNILGLIEGAVGENHNTSTESILHNSKLIHKEINKAFDCISKVLTTAETETGLPLQIDAVQPISPLLRCSGLFPPLPHPFLGGKSKSNGTHTSGATLGEPILIQIRFEGNKNWPSDINAMGAAKCALLVKLATAIENGKFDGFDGPCVVYPNHLDVGFHGFSWRIIVRADQEIRMLEALRKPTKEAISSYKTLIRRHEISSLHHSSVYSINTQHPSWSGAVRLAQRWVAAHMLSGHITIEALELIVAKAYVDPSPLESPTTAISGFVRFLCTMGEFDWVRKPFIVDPHGQLTSQDLSDIHTLFQEARGATFQYGPPMYIISPFDCLMHDNVIKEFMNESNFETEVERRNNIKWQPTVTSGNKPELVVLSRMKSLALLSYRHLIDGIAFETFKGDSNWIPVFQESATAIKSYSLLLRVDPELIVDDCCSSFGKSLSSSDNDGAIQTPFSKSIEKRNLGPKSMKMKIFKNISMEKKYEIVHGWQPLEEVITVLRNNFSSVGVFFFNELSPNAIAMLCRPTITQPKPFSVQNTENRYPIGKITSDTRLIVNVHDVLREIIHRCSNVVTSAKIMDEKLLMLDMLNQNGKKRKFEAKDINEAEDVLR